MAAIPRTLLDRCIRKEMAAQFELYGRLRVMLFSTARRYERDDLHQKNMVNTAFLRILTHLHTWKPQAPFEGWCHRIMVNTVLNDLRDRRAANGGATHVEEKEDLRAVVVFDLNDVEDWIEADALQYMLDRLPEVTRKVFNLHVIDGWKHQEIADILDMPVNTSKWHVARARHLLKAMLEPAAARTKTAHCP